MKKIAVVIADSQYLVVEGVKSLLQNIPTCECAGVSGTRESFMSLIPQIQPDLLIVDYTSDACDLRDIGMLLPFIPNTKILAITPHLNKRSIQSALDAGICSYILKDCGEDEIIDAILTTARGEKFFCGKVLDTLLAEENDSRTSLSTATCEALNISDRELEIIRLIAEGNSNKQIAEQLFLSQHTINTHRKNIMSKLGVNNTAGIVLFAVKEHLISPNRFLFSANS